MRMTDVVGNAGKRTSCPYPGRSVVCINIVRFDCVIKLHIVAVTCQDTASYFMPFLHVFSFSSDTTCGYWHCGESIVYLGVRVLDRMHLAALISKADDVTLTMAAKDIASKHNMSHSYSYTLTQNARKI